MNREKIIAEFSREDITGDDIFTLARSVSYFYQNPESDLSESLDLIIRLIDRKQFYENKLNGVGRMIDAIAREAGLYPYIDIEDDWKEEFVIELMKAPGLDNIVFHIEQQKIFQKLLSGKSVILSAPTSFGKSLLIDALISAKSPQVVVAVVPTIALLDEFRRRMTKNFRKYQIITHSSEVRTKDHVIYIGTQERILERRDINSIDLFVLDEFYKLDLERGDQRSTALNAVLAKFGKKADQLYLLGPSINEVPNSNRYREDIEFIRTQYSPVTADIINRTDTGPSPEYLMSDLRSVGDSPSLVYVRSPRSAWTLAYELVDQGLYNTSSFCSDLGEWLENNFHPEWILAKSVKHGIGIHHGRVPRSIAHLIITLFNTSELKAILCTSSMIEGVNTAAENVFIYDRNISVKKLDRFTFDNIKGRAGRLFKHKIGRIYLYNMPPEESEYAVRVSLFDDDELMSPELLVQIDDESLTSTAQRRKKFITETSILPMELLRRWAEFGVEKLNYVAENLIDEVNNEEPLLMWKGIPTYNQLTYTFEVAWGRFDFPKHGIRTPTQLVYFANRLRRNVSTRGFLEELVKETGLEAQKEIDQCFNFMRGAEYSFPQVLRALNDIIDFLIGEGVADYRVYANKLQNLFLPGELRTLDEYGVPIPILQKSLDYLNVDDLINSRKSVEDPESIMRRKLSEFENRILTINLD